MVNVQGLLHIYFKVLVNTCLQIFFMFQIDAHMDINTPSTSLSGNIHGMPLSFLIKGVPEVICRLSQGYKSEVLVNNTYI